MQKILLFTFTLFASLIFSETKTITVKGTGTISIKPDTVVISTGVDSGHPDIGVALEENNKIMSKIFKGLNDLGINKDQIKTSNYHVYLYKPYNRDNNEIEEYRVSNTIIINIKDLEIVDTVLDKLINLGANKIDGIRFTAQDREAYKKELMTQAVKDARTKAEFLAELENMKIVEVVSIIEDGVTIPAPEPLRLRMAAEMDSFAPPISEGSETISTSYSITYRIESK